MNWEDRLNIVSHTVNFSIVLYILKSALQPKTFELSNPLLAIFGLIIAILLNIIGTIVVLKRSKKL